MRTIMILLLTGCIFAEDSNTKPPEIPAPTVSMEHRASFWRRDSENEKAKFAALSAKAALAMAFADIKKDCGEYPVVLSQAGEPSCAKAKPDVPTIPPHMISAPTEK